MFNILVFALSVIVPIGGISWHSTSADPVVVVGQENWTQTAPIPTKITWSEASKSLAKRAIDSAAAELNSMLKELRAQGATSVTTRSTEATNTYLKKYGLHYLKISYQGLRPDGSNTGVVNEFPKVQSAQVNNLVTLNKSKCSLLSFNLFNTDTWFQTQCEVVKPTIEKFLRARLAIEINSGPGNLPDEINYELSKLRYLLKHKIAFKISGDTLTFNPARTPFGDDNSVWLKSQSGWFDFEITVDREKLVAQIKYLAPRPEILFKHAHYDRDSNSINF